MIDTHLKMQLEKATVDLDKTADVEGILIVATDGQILHHNLRLDVDINLFGPMSQVISNSSHRLLNSSGQGEMERVLVESSGGKALFLGLENAHLIILMQNSANVGLIMVNAKRASEQINEATHDLKLEVPEEVPVKDTPLEPTPIEETPIETTVADEPSLIEEPPIKGIPEIESISEPPAERVKVEKEAVKIQGESVAEPVEGLTEEPVKDLEAPKSAIEAEKPIFEPDAPESQEVKTELQTTEVEKAVVEKTLIEEAEPETVEAEPEEVRPSIPTVKPPISFPSLPKDVEVPDDPQKRSDLILDIYESIFLAMSMGAAKIMGVAPAKGLTKQFLPFEKCQRLLQNVDLKSNATIDFAQIKKNAAEIPLQEREEIFIRDFSRMIEIITKNYGRVMGYEAFRGMVRAEFLAIKESYGDAMDKLNIKKNIHPEIAHLFN